MQAAVHARVAGIYNVAGNEAVPLSMLARWTGRASLPAPGPAAATGSRRARACSAPRRRAIAPSALRFGFTLDTSRAERELGFRPSDRIGLARAGDGALRVETAAI